jgi:multiple sugar transport system substrate-binding protein
VTDTDAGITQPAALSRRGFLRSGGAIAAGLAAAPLVGSLAGCSSNDSGGPMSFWNFYSPGGTVPAQTKWFEDTIAEWNKTQRRTRDKIALRYIPNPDYINGSILSTGFASNAGPDIFLLSPGDFLRYYNGGALQDITPYMEHGARDDYLPGALDTRVINGKVYGLPMEIEPLAIYYNQKAFEDAHLSEGDIPKTWDQLLDVGRKLRTNDRFGLAFEVTPGYYQNFTWYPFMWMGGGGPVDKAGDASTFDSAATRAGLELWAQTISQGISPRSLLGTGGGDVPSNLASGYTAMQQSGVWSIGDIAASSNPKFPLGAFKLPLPPGGNYTTTLGGWAFVANARGRSPEKAAEFCAWALSSMSPEGIDRARRWNTVAKTNLPPRKSVRAAAQQHGAFKGLFAQFADSIAIGGRGEPRYPPQIYKAISDAVQEAQLGGSSPSAAAGRAGDIINSFLKGYRGARIS